MSRIRCFSELNRLETFEERFEYLKLGGQVGIATFGYDRYLNQLFYTSGKWKHVRNQVIIRDNGCDLGIQDREINDCIYVHHMNAITIEDIELDRPHLYDIDLLICTSFNTHTAIHYSDESILLKVPKDRVSNDTCPWKR